MYKKRPDLAYTGRTLFGAPPPKGQELDDHYFGAIAPRVSAFMRELEEELWMVGSTFSLAGPNVVLNTAIAEILCQFADELELSKDFTSDLAKLVKRTYGSHKRIVFNGNNYADEWVTEAESRGLSNLKTTAKALPQLISQKSIDLFAKHQVLSEAELHSRYELRTENYCTTLHIEALTMIELVKGRIIPACITYQNEISKLPEQKKHGKFDISLEEYLLSRIAKLSARMLKKLIALEDVLSAKTSDCADYYRDKVFNAMSELRLAVDELETIIAKKHWPLPSYAELLYSAT